MTVNHFRPTSRRRRSRLLARGDRVSFDVGKGRPEAINIQIIKASILMAA
jgi:cold shock CspA family protein